MFTVPIAAFFGAKQILTEQFHIEPPFNQVTTIHNYNTCSNFLC
jgi:hypothetical protein